MRFSRRLNMALATAFLALPSLLAAPVAAQDFPSRIIRVVVAFAPVTLVVRPTTILVVRPDMPIASAKELAALAKTKPGEIPFASTGSGSMPHLALELYQSAADVKFLHVPYRGAAPALTDLLGGQVQALFADTPVDRK